MNRIFLLAIFLFVMTSVISAFGQESKGDTTAQVITRDELLAPVSVNGKWGFANPKGEAIIPIVYDGAGAFSEKWANVKVGNYWGYINKENKWTLKPVFTEAFAFRDNRALISVFDRSTNITYSGYINKVGSFDIILEGSEVGYDYHEGLARVRSQDEKGIAFGFRDTTGSWAIKAQFTSASDFHDGMAAVMVGNTWGYIDPKGKFMIKPAFKTAYAFSEGAAYVDFGNDKGFISKKGKRLFTLKSDESAIFFQEGMLAFRRNGRMGFVNMKGKEIIPPKFENIVLSRFSEGLAIAEVIENNIRKVGFINKEGQWVIPAQYQDARDFSNGFAFVKKDGKFGVIDAKGNWISEPKYDEAGPFMPTYR